MRKVVPVWHAHHQNPSPLENLSSYKERVDTIKYQKSISENAVSIARRKKLFKKVKGGIKALPVSFQKAYARLIAADKKYYALRDKFNAATYPEPPKLVKQYDRASHAQDVASDKFFEMFDKPTKAVLKLHKDQCGCGWQPYPNNDLLIYKP